jgi:alkylated DNA repair dioxygenase AlkB
MTPDQGSLERIQAARRERARERATRTERADAAARERACRGGGGAARATKKMPSLFDADGPDGFVYRNDFISSEEEAQLVDAIRQVEFSAFEMRGVVARRRVAFFGSSYDAGRTQTLPLPAFLLPLRERAAAFAGVEPDAFAMALINEYPPGAPIGWHRDAPQYDIVFGVSLLSACRMMFRPYVSPSAERAVEGRRRKATHQVVLERRSAYLMAGGSRAAYEHHIPAVAELRYSITFRTLR